MRDIIKSLVLMLGVGVVLVGATSAAFTASTSVQDSTFSTGTAELQMVQDVSGDPVDYTAGNLDDSVAGLTFDNIYPGWIDFHGVIVFNTGSLDLVTSAVSAYDSGDAALGDVIEVRAFEWIDGNHDGIADNTELGSAFGGWRTLNDWETNKFNFGELEDGTPLPVAFKFRTTSGMDDTYQNKSVVYDYIFNGTTDGAIQE